MDEEDYIIKTPISKSKIIKRNIVLDDNSDEDNYSISNNEINNSSNSNNNDNSFGDISLDDDFKTPSPKRNRLTKKIIKSPKSNNSSTNNSPLNNNNNNNNNNNKITPLSPLSPKVKKLLQQQQIQQKSPSPLKRALKQPPQLEEVEEEDSINNDQIEDYSNNNSFEEEVNENGGTMTYIPDSPNKSPLKDSNVNIKSKTAPNIKITNRKVVSRTIKEKDVLSENGMRKLYKNLKNSKFSSKHSNKANLELLFGIYSKWSKEINPAISLEDSIVKMEALSKTRLVKNHIEDIKNGVYDKDVEFQDIEKSNDNDNKLDIDDNDVSRVSPLKSQISKIDSSTSSGSVNITTVSATTTKPAYQNPFSFIKLSNPAKNIQTSTTTTRPLFKVSLPTRPVKK